MSDINNKIGAVLITGGGIAGIQASLDLAEMGFYVYLVDKNPALGGRMAQLDKVFPTNDCSMCIISPKLNEVGGHINIKTINCAEILDVQGESGNFLVKILQKPRYLDITKCTACGDCAKVCPVDLPSEFNLNLNTRKVPYKSYAQAYPNEYSLTKGDLSPCVISCPAHVNAHAYMSLAAQGRFQEALEVILDILPLPEVLGRICTHPCELNCRRGLLEGPLAIREIKRLIATKANLREAGKTILRKDPQNDRVAIIGAGPAGLTCAYHLARHGIKSTIFEASNVAGGALRLGIPNYRLPENTLQKEIDFILHFSGTEIKYNTVLGEDITLDSLFSDGFSAIFLALGAHEEARLNIPGADLQGVISGIKFLRNFNLGERIDLKNRKVLVLGGGNVALDSARVAIRLGAETTLAYRRDRKAMPAWDSEINEAVEEGLEILTFRAPLKFEKKGLRLLAHLVKTIPIGNKKDRSKELIYDKSDILHEKYDLIIYATGQKPSSQPVKNDPYLKLGKNGNILINPLSFETHRPRVFAGGDVNLGPSDAIYAIQAGKEVALSISRIFSGEDPLIGRGPLKLTGNEKYQPLPVNRPQHYRQKVTLIPAKDRKQNFNAYDLGLSEEEAQQEASRCLACGACSQCFQCVKACLPKALTLETHNQTPETIEISVGSIILSTGFDPFDPSDCETYRYKDSPNIVTSLEFERILSASGPFQGHMQRPLDQKEPTKIAWLQCVGSREINRCDRRFCSSVCCMYAMKEAIIAKEHSKNPLVTSIFYMDIRNYGKDFVKYYNRAINSGVNFIRSRVHTLSPLSNGDIFLEYLNEFGELCNDTFDMVVLSVGMTPNSALPKLAEKLNFALNEEGFVKTLPFQPVTTSRPGIFSCGVINEPKDIPTTVMEASAAACAAAEAIQESRFTRTLSRVYPEERDTSSEIPRIGVFICHCGINIASIINVQDVVSYTRSLPFVELVSDNLFTCSADTQTKIKQAIIEHKLNRVVVASCSPRTHEAMFQETLAQAGLNKYLFEMANIRDQDSWVHQKEPLKATRKAKDLVRGAIAKAALLEPMYQTRMDLIREALVVGGGVSGLTAALAIAKMGYKTHLLEATKSLGGNAKNIFSRENDLPLFVENLINEVINHPLISIYFESTPLSSEGFVGNFETTVKTSDKNILIQHGVTVLTPGGKPHIPQSYLYGKHKQIILSLDLSELLQNKDKSLKNPGKTFVFIQCVESRDQNRPYCSKVCCFHALESALSILDLNPKATIYILYRDIQAYGLREKLYQEARARGVRFFRYTEDQEPQIKPKDNGDLEIIIEDHVLHRPLLINANLVILESGVDPVPLKKEIVEVFKAQLNSEGFLLEAHAKLRPVDLATSGQFIAGLCHSPKPLEESISQAKAAAARAIAILSKPYILVGGVVAKVDPEKCAVCCTCVRTCPVRVPKIIPNSENSSSHGHAFMEPAICQGCGICVSECPAKAIKLQFFSDEELVAKVTALAESSMI